MEKATGNLTVYFEEPFWVGVYERRVNGAVEVARVVFNTEPGDGELYEYLRRNFARLPFGPPSAQRRADRREGFLARLLRRLGHRIRDP